MSSRFKRPSAALVVAMLALFVAIGGTATAAFVVTSKTIKNGTIRGADIHKKTITKNKLTNGAVNSLKGQNGAPGAPGSALGFVTVLSNGQVDTAHSSSNVQQANVSRPAGAPNTTCFSGLPFTPKLALGNVDLNFAVANTVQTNAGAVGGNNACPAGTQASAVQVNNSGTTVSPVTMYIAFY